MNECDALTATSAQGFREFRVAVLVLHGVGQQDRFETLASFAAGLAEAAGVEEVTRTPLLIDDKLESALTVDLPGVKVDLIEYYYQPLMQRKVGLSDVTRWLVETGFHIRRLYREYDFKSADPQGARAARPPPNGDFLKLHYMLYQQGNRIAVWFLWSLAWLIDLLEHWRDIPLTPLVRVPLRYFLGRFIDPVLKEVAGDLILYTAFDPKLSLSSVRDEVLKGCIERLETIIRCEKEGEPRYRQVFVVGHSLGSVVAYDAVSRIAMRTDYERVTGLKSAPVLTTEEVARLGGLVTFGSPLDKIALMFWPRFEEPASNDASNFIEWQKRRTAYRQGLLAHFHGIRGLSEALRLPASVRQPPTGSFADLPWLNVHHPDDLIAGHLDAFAGVENLQLDQKIEATFAATRTAEAHGIYWSDPAIYNWLRSRFTVSGA
ncbi:hypothetical protein [Pararhodobacter sp. SW119]|uniref:hypothetical protein n=1 Tax=Pararhodobacter sp. SW119 TaxID=2780075 RepID=UPI001AE029BA|nr:hypothetical protein [Pararhodobacter sp. SW119]